MYRLFSQRFCCLAALLTTTATAPDLHLLNAKNHLSLNDKVSSLRQCLRDYPETPAARTARQHLITLLMTTNRYEEALLEYRKQPDIPLAGPDLQFLELLLKTGRYSEIRGETAMASAQGQDFLRQERLFELRVQAFLARGNYREAGKALDQWLDTHAEEGLKTGRFTEDIENLQRSRRYVHALEKLQGPQGKPLFTESVTDSLSRWSRRQEIPIIFFKLLPADPANQHPTAQHVLESNHTDTQFTDLVNEVNRGFLYLSGGVFSLRFKSAGNLYARTDDLTPSGSRSSLLASRVYVHTIPPIYKWAGKGFVILVDYRTRSEEEAAYMGDGIIHIAANKLRPMTLMHEILHGLGATHQEWNVLKRLNYQFDPADRGLMTFTSGELLDLGLEEKNRVLLDWPRVATLPIPNEMITQAPLSELPSYADLSSNPAEISGDPRKSN